MHINCTYVSRTFVLFVCQLHFIHVSQAENDAVHRNHRKPSIVVMIAVASSTAVDVDATKTFRCTTDQQKDQLWCAIWLHALNRFHEIFGALLQVFPLRWFLDNERRNKGRALTVASSAIPWSHRARMVWSRGLNQHSNQPWNQYSNRQVKEASTSESVVFVRETAQSAFKIPEGASTTETQCWKTESQPWHLVV